MTHPFEQELISHWTPRDWSNVTVLLAVSGGADSMALLRAVLATRTSGAGQMAVLHFNHRLRGAESDQDEAFVWDQSARFGLKCEVARSDAQNPMLTEESLRTVRYRFFANAAKAWGARYVATAHTLDDQAETVLHRVVRGTGLRGLAGIPRVRELLPGVSLIRPLLASTRRQVLTYLESLGQSYRSDSTNADSSFTRNRLRNDLIPLLQQQYNPQVKEALVRLGNLAGEAHDALEGITRALWRRTVAYATASGAEVDCQELQAEHPFLVRELLIAVWRACDWGLREMTYEHWLQLSELVKNPVSSRCRLTFPGGVAAERLGMRLRLSVPAGTSISPSRR